MCKNHPESSHHHTLDVSPHWTKASWLQMHHSLLASKAPPMTSSKLWRSQSSPSSHVLRIAFLCARASVRQCTEGVISCVLTSIVFWDHTFVVKKGSDKSACAGVIHNLRTHHHPHNISLNWTEESSWLPRDHKKKPSALKTSPAVWNFAKPNISKFTCT